MKKHTDLLIDVTKGQFSPTILECFIECPRKFYLKYIQRMEQKEQNVHFGFGSAIHSGVAQFYLSKHEGKPFPERKLRTLQAFTKEWKELGILGTDEKNLESGLLALNEYCDTYRDDGQEFLPEFIECDFAMPMPNGTTLKGITDRVIKLGGNIVVDTKTTKSALTDWFWKKYDNSFQMLSYYNVVKMLTGDANGIMVDAIRVPLKDPIKDLGRKIIPVTELQEEEWLNTYLSVTDQIKFCLSSPNPELAFRQHHTACSNYGGCEFLNPCVYGMNHPEVMERFVRGSGVTIEL